MPVPGSPAERPDDGQPGGRCDEACVEEAADWIAERWRHRPFAGVVLGSGLAGLSDHIDVETQCRMADIPHFTAPSADGHDGSLLFGWLGPVPLLAFSGRLHRYERHPHGRITFGIRVLRRLGGRLLALSNAAGGIDPAYRQGDVMILDDHLDLTEGDPLERLFSFDAPTEAANCYDARLSEWAMANAIRDGRPIRRGCYVAMTGPNYETRAEYRLLRRLGIGTVGMSTAPEAEQARRIGLRVLALSTVTNVCDPDALEPTCHDDVMAAAAKAEEHVREIVREVITQAYTEAILGGPSPISRS